MVMVFVRILLVSGLAALCTLAALGIGMAADRTGMEPLFGALLMAAAVSVIVVGAVVAIIGVGGWALARYDVAAERTLMA